MAIFYNCTGAYKNEQNHHEMLISICDPTLLFAILYETPCRWRRPFLHFTFTPFHHFTFPPVHHSTRWRRPTAWRTRMCGVRHTVVLLISSPSPGHHRVASGASAARGQTQISWTIFVPKSCIFHPPSARKLSEQVFITENRHRMIVTDTDCPWWT